MDNFRNLIEIIALFAAGSYFIYKLIDGWGLVNLSLELDANRQTGDETDLVAIVLKLNKGDRGSLELHTVELRCSPESGMPDIFRIPLIYPLKLRPEVSLQDDETRIQTNKKENMV